MFAFGTSPGLGKWLSKDINPIVLERLQKLDKEPLTKVQFNQLGNFGADGQFGVFEDEIGDLGKAAAQDRIIRVQLQVLLLEDFSYSFHL